MIQQRKAGIKVPAIPDAFSFSTIMQVYIALIAPSPVEVIRKKTSFVNMIPLIRLRLLMYVATLIKHGEKTYNASFAFAT